MKCTHLTILCCGHQTIPAPVGIDHSSGMGATADSRHGHRHILLWHALTETTGFHFVRSVSWYYPVQKYLKHFEHQTVFLLRPNLFCIIFGTSVLEPINGCRIVFVFFPSGFGFFLAFFAGTICNSLELELVILHGICYIMAWSLCILHGICYI